MKPASLFIRRESSNENSRGKLAEVPLKIQADRSALSLAVQQVP